MNTTCYEARLVSDLENALKKTSSSNSSLSPNDLLVNISWPLLLILSIAAICASGQADAIKEIEQATHKWKKEGKSEVLLSLMEQMLIRKVDAVLRDFEQQRLHLHRFQFSKVNVREGLPDDQRFAQLCRESASRFDNLESLSLKLYEEALAHTGTEGDLAKLFDPVLFPGTSPMIGHNVLDESERCKQYRQNAQKKIRSRVDRWQAQVVALQQKTVNELLDSPVVLQFRHAQSSEIKSAIRAAFAAKGYPLLPTAL